MLSLRKIISITVALALWLVTIPLWGAGTDTAPAASPTPAAQPLQPGNLQVAPTRIIFESNPLKRTREVVLINVGDTKATYRLSMVRQRMTETGKIELIEKGQEKADELFADNLVRFSPHQVTLEPRAAQSIRIQLTKPENLADGEYRSHLYLRAVPPEKDEKATSAADTNGGLVVNLVPIFGISIPVIVRQGQLSAKVTLSDLALQLPTDPQQPPMFAVRMNRTGTQSTFGDLTVTYTAAGSKPVLIGQINGIAVYTPNASRLAAIPLGLPKLKGGHFTVRYQQKADDGGVLWAEATLAVP